MIDLLTIAKVLNHYNLTGNLIKAEKYGYGLINTTMLITTQDVCGIKHQYILQKINNKLFKNVKGLMNNIELITSFLKIKNSAEDDNDRKVLTLIKTKNNKNYVHISGQYFRIYLYIKNSLCLQITKDLSIFEEAGKAFGKFQNQLSDFDANKLCTILPDFHNTEKRFKAFIEAYKKSKVRTINQDLYNEIINREKYCHIIIDAINQNLLPIRVTHNDTKLNNVVFDKKSKKALAILDLDTVMPSTLCYDFGDAIRFGCNTEKEDQTDTSKIDFDLQLFEAFTRGYLLQAKDSLTEKEKELLAVSCLVITYELSLRFFTDYLQNDIYFKANYPEHNFDRAKNQFSLLLKMEEKFEQMNNIVEKYC